MNHRALTFLCSAALCAGCASENELIHTSTLQSSTRGVALADDGAQGFAGMAGTTCTIDANWGCAVADADLPTSEEVVHDHWRDITVGGTTSSVYQIGPGGWTGEDGDVRVEQLRSARLSEAGLRIVHGDATACFFRDEAGHSSAIPGAACADDADLSVDRSSGDLFAATSEGLYALRGDGAQRLGDAALHVSWDRGTRQVLAVDADAHTLRAVGLDGTTAWTRRSDTRITSLASRGGLGELLVLVQGDQGFGVVERRDASTGRVLGRTQVPDADATLLVSEHGARVAMVRDEAVHFYALEAGVEPEDLATEIPECINLRQRD
jgi:hypothetical protein